MRNKKDKYEYDKNYRKENYRWTIFYIPKSDTKVNEYLAKQKPMSKYIRRLIKEDIENERIEKARAANK